MCQIGLQDGIYSTIFYRSFLADHGVGDKLKGKLRTRTGEKQLRWRPPKIDKLPRYIRDAIVQLRSEGRFWRQIEVLSARPFSENWPADGGGFVDWEAFPKEVLALFPGRRIPCSNLHRWYDLRVEQGAV